MSLSGAVNRQIVKVHERSEHDGDSLDYRMKKCDDVFK